MKYKLTKWETNVIGIDNINTSHLNNYYKFILKNHKKDGQTKVRTASFTPLNYSKLFFKKGVTDNLIFTGTEELQQEYVFTNFIFEENPKFLDKYEVPSNYKKVFQLRRGNIVLNEVFLRD